MSRLSKINKLREFRHAEKVAAEARHAIKRARNPRSIAKSDANITPKRIAAGRKERGNFG